MVLANVLLEFRLHGIHVEMRICRKDINGTKIVLLPQHIVVCIVRGRNFQATCTEADFYITVFNNRNNAPDTGNNHVFAFEPLVLFLFGIDANRNIAKNRLGTSRRHNSIFAGLFDNGITKVIEFRMFLVIDYFFIRKGRLAFRVPVYHT